MSKKIICAACGKEIKNIYVLNGKNYGYSCYRKEIIKIAKQKEEYMDSIKKIDVFCLVEILKTKKTNSFVDSIINFYKENNFLSHNQINCLSKYTLTDADKFNIELLKLEIYKAAQLNENDIKSQISETYSMLQQGAGLKCNTNILKRFFHDERLNNLVKPNLHHNNVLSLVAFRDLEDVEEGIDKVFYTVSRNTKDLVKYQNDEDIEILDNVIYTANN